MRFLSALLLAFVLSPCCSAEMPEYYKSVDRLVWIVWNVDHAIAGWTKLGMSEIHRYPRTTLTGRYRNQPVTIHVEYVTGRLGDVTVDMLQPAKGERNAFTDFHSRHGDGIFSVVHAAPSGGGVNRQVQRLKGLGMEVLQQVTVGDGTDTVRFTFSIRSLKANLYLGLLLPPLGSNRKRVRCGSLILLPLYGKPRPSRRSGNALEFPG
jgi:hypothetical protein